MRPACPSLNRFKRVHKILNVGVHNHKKSSKSKVELKNMSALCQQQLYAVFQLVDNGGKGYISSEDLIRVSSTDSNDGGIAEVLHLLRLGDRDTLDFDEFCRRVFDIVKSKKSPSPEPKSRMQTPIIRSLMVKSNNKENRVFEDDDHHRNTSLARGNETCNRRKKAPQESGSDLENQLDDIRAEVRQEVRKLFKENAKRLEDQIQKRYAALERAIEERMISDRKHVESLLKSEEDAACERIRELETQQEKNECHVQTLKEVVHGLKVRLEDKIQQNERLETTVESLNSKCDELLLGLELTVEQIRELRLNKSLIDERTEMLESRLEADAERITSLSKSLESARDGLEEDRVSGDVDREETKHNIRELKAEVTQLSETVERAILGRPKEEFQRATPSSPGSIRRSFRASRSMSSSMSNVSVALEAFAEDTDDCFDSFAQIMSQNKELSCVLDRMTAEKAFLHQRVETVTEERNKYREGCPETSSFGPSIVKHLTSRLRRTKSSKKMESLQKEVVAAMAAREKTQVEERSSLEESLNGLRQKVMSLEAKVTQQLGELRSWMEDCQFEHSRVGAHGGAGGGCGACPVSEKGAKRCVAIVVTDIEQRLSTLEMNRRSR